MFVDKKIAKYCLVILIMLFTVNVNAQEMLGISNSNFAGNMGMGLNPSLFVGSPYRYEYNFISGDFFIDNNYIYLKKRSSLIRKSLVGEAVSEDRIQDYYDTNKKNAYANAFLRGPSLIVNNEKFSWGVHTALRYNLSAVNVPYHLAKFIKEGFDYIPQHDEQFSSDPFRSATMMWGELGGTIGKKLYEKRDKGTLYGAVTLKLLLGFDGAYVHINDFDYIVPSSKELIVNNVDGEYAHAFQDNEEGKLKKPFKIRGFGGGADIGLTYYRGKVHGAGDCNNTAEIRKKYKYRAGFSIIDIGFIKFNKNAHVFSFDNASAYWPGIDTVKYHNISYLDTSISNHFFGDPYTSGTADKFSIFLPTALSFQFDYCIIPRIYANISVIQGIPLSKYAIVRPSQIALSARYETRRFEVAMPLTIYNYRTPHLGLAFRWSIFVIGTDRLGSFTGLWDTTGYDIFFGFKANVCDIAGKRGKKPFCPVN